MINPVLRKKVPNPSFNIFLNRKLAGFSLIEILVVLAIIGILASASMAYLTNVKQRARIVAFKATASSISPAAVLCCNSSGSPGLNAIIVPPSNPGNIHICDNDIGPKYPNATQIDSVSVDSADNCLNGSFSITIYPGTSNSGLCNHADCTEEGCTYDGC
jgi:prepilin-type N-terminal cleavage/methylation domain-containing protein